MKSGFLASIGIAATLLLTPVGAPSPANAVTVNINIGNGSSLNFGRGITCSQGANIIRRRGFTNVAQRNCTGRNFVYRADRRRSRYEISVRASDGRVLDYRWLRRI
jgi:hypothetical protein